ncbi:VOC family protein [Acanthopleuribacter pedis]|uniref:VOC family protein n=1 Tax=Acanthopleuribacter pedis TaxID=442870 RepID=A0A8J7QCC3_9BACT|nr:VOC family protein [Acanthopleuribacter pedis]MBO1321852.1 VOC family protein [Acanthopleuribacter pedis]
MKNVNNSINYIEFPLVAREQTMAFYQQAFGWTFQEWGPDYLSFSGAGVEGGFNREEGVAPGNPGVLVILFADDLEATQKAVEAAGGKVVREPYGFPGGRRFHFTDPNGNQLAVWTPA